VTFKKGRLDTVKEGNNEFEGSICCVDCVACDEGKETFGLLGRKVGIVVVVVNVDILVGVVVARGVDRILLLFLPLLLLENKFKELFKVSILGVVGNGTGGKGILKDVGNVI